MKDNNVIKFFSEEDVRMCVNRITKALVQCNEACIQSKADKKISSLIGKINSHRKAVRSIRNHLRFGTLQIDKRVYRLCTEWLELCDIWDDIRDTYIQNQYYTEIWNYADLKSQ